MPDSYNLPSEQEVLAICLAFFQAQPSLSDAPLGAGTFEGDTARAVAGCISTVIEAQRGAYHDGVPSVYADENGVQKTRMSSAGVERWAQALAIPSNRGPGKYGRNAAQAARGGSAIAAGTPGTIVGSGSLLTAPGGVTLELRSGFTLGVLGTADATIDAQSVGLSSNLAAGTKLRWQSPPIGLDPEITLTGALTDGYDIESDLSLALRVLDYLQNAVSGGTAADLRRWLTEAQDGNGRLVGNVEGYVWPHRDGTGTTTLMGLLGGSGRGRDPGATKLAQTQAWIDALKITTDTHYVVRPWQPPDQDLTIHCYIQPSPDGAFDWNSVVAGLSTVLSGTAAAFDIVCTGATPPAELAAAIANGSKPRVQLPLPTWSPIPFQARVLSVANNTPMAGQHTLTLDTALPVNMPGTGACCPGGAAVLPVAFAVLDMVDHVGPSRASGYAAEEWHDSVTIARIAHAAIQARDDAGYPVCVTLPNTGNPLGGPPVGVLMAVGAGGFTTEDFDLADNGSGPQLPVCASIVVFRTEA